MGGDLSYPAVGMLIFASCLVVVNRAGSYSFNSPRPFLTLGSGVISEETSHNDARGLATAPNRFTSYQLSMHFIKSLLCLFLSVWYAVLRLQPVVLAEVGCL